MDGCDPDDAIVFIVGLENMADDTCAAILRDNDAAEQFLLTLSDNKDQYHKSAMRALAKWMKVAGASQKKFFKDMIQYLFENDDAYK